ncbi:hypothetical protein B9G55_06065 [Saccharibacillus sp. O16]|nr:hypothetical protein B9G55_06065 [Saccharibacillus sp. O16]
MCTLSGSSAGDILEPKRSMGGTSMYKVIVADDEPMMLEGWRTMIDWAAYGYELCGAASDGEEALELFHAVQPDLLVTDIRMPGLDGLELIRAIRSHPDCQVRTIIVSGYAEFGYAQQAMRFGVDRYVLKPIVTEEIHDVLGDLYTLLDQHRLEQLSDEALRAAEEEASVLRLLQGGCSPAQASRVLGASAQSGLCMLLAEACGMPETDERGRDSARAAMRLASGELRSSGIPCWNFEEGGGRSGLLAACEPRLLERRLEMLRETFPWLSLYASGGEHGYEALPKLYAQALAVRERMLPFGRSGWYRHGEVEPFGRVGFAESLTAAQHVLARVEAGEPDEAARAAADLFRLFERLSAPTGWMEGIVRYLVGELLRRRAEIPAAHRGAVPEEEPDLSGERFHMPTTEAELILRCKREAERVRQGRMKSENSSSPLAEAVEYVRRHYKDKLQLRELAEKFHLNPVYFGQQFKRETGHGFNDYVHLLRAQEAQRLLRRTDMKVAEIGCMLGYHDTEYFTCKFKAATGELPSQYRAKEWVRES